MTVSCPGTATAIKRLMPRNEWLTPFQIWDYIGIGSLISVRHALRELVAAKEVERAGEPGHYSYRLG